MNVPGNRSAFRSVLVGHMTLDMFGSMAPVMLAFLAAHTLSMSNTQIGVAVSLYQLAGSLSQPIFGLLSDRTGGRWLAAGGVAWTVSLLLSSLAIAQATQNYTLMLIPYVLAAFGSGAFHPAGAMHAAEADSARLARNSSIFFFMGQTGLAIGPVLAGFLLDRAATNNNLFTQSLGPVYAGALVERGTVVPVLAVGLIAIVPVLYMALSIPGRHDHRARRVATTTNEAVASARASFPVKAFLFFALVVALRSLINPGTMNFIPRLFQLRGWDASSYGLIAGLFSFGGAIAGVAVGNMADRYDSRYLVAGTLILAAPALFLMTVLEGLGALLMAFLAGGLSGSSHSLLVVQAQGFIPGRKGLASGMILGFIFATGALGSLLIGSLSDRIGLAACFQLIAGITIFTGLLGLALPPDRRRGRAPAPDVALAEAAVTGAD